MLDTLGNVKTDHKTDENEIEELIVEASSSTGTVALLDKFEGFGPDKIKYERIVIKNYAFRIDLFDWLVPVHLVIERGRSNDCVGNITFTEYKKRETALLKKYVESELKNVEEKYLDTDRFYRFSKPYLLRAQNSSNRTGYGWEWDWSGGIGIATEGTEYGETTKYHFVGAYLSSRFYYDPQKRKPFNTD